MYVGIGFIETARTRALPLSGVCHYWCEDEVPVSYPSLDGEHHHKAESFFILINFNYSDFTSDQAAIRAFRRTHTVPGVGGPGTQLKAGASR
jgi:hypothetical protein